MTTQGTRKQLFLILLVFLVSRSLLPVFEINFEYHSIYTYWQYLDIETLQQDLLHGLWFDHTQPPFFNLLLGWLLKLSGSQAPVVFMLLFKVLSLTNTILLFQLSRKWTNDHAWIPLATALLYLLSPGTMIMEHELFYTPLISFLLLLAARALGSLQNRIGWRPSLLFFGSLTLICLTRSMYHLYWLIVIALLLGFYYRGRAGWKKLMLCAGLAIALTGSVYVKNKVVFGKFTASTWLGMNLARNVFHDVQVSDSASIARIEPFSAISAYRDYIPESFVDHYRGKMDRVLIKELKNGIYLNEKQVGYIPVSDAYLAACKNQVKARPAAYLKNVAQSAIIYFAPMTRYPSTEFQARKLRYYDLLYSFNLSQLAEGKQQRRVALVLSALPKMAFYAFIFVLLFLEYRRKRSLAILPLFVTLLFAYSFTVSSFFEHFENMRFRFEAEPLFLVVAGTMIYSLLQRRKKKRE